MLFAATPDLDDAWPSLWSGLAAQCASLLAEFLDLGIQGAVVAIAPSRHTAAAVLGQWSAGTETPGSTALEDVGALLRQFAVLSAALDHLSPTPLDVNIRPQTESIPARARHLVGVQEKPLMVVQP